MTGEPDPPPRPMKGRCALGGVENDARPVLFIAWGDWTGLLFTGDLALAATLVGLAATWSNSSSSELTKESSSSSSSLSLPFVLGTTYSSSDPSSLSPKLASPSLSSLLSMTALRFFRMILFFFFFSAGLVFSAFLLLSFHLLCRQHQQVVFVFVFIFI
eukprot:CAMPEP_0184524690 /NCGR_PEP_ID=MMETSP0198_2-20121128/9666_1 /TAXON_ID=1112570 /ORGANISM="Thraustochytrium sp., Strain LLF1b" /LENGTH=158 /DNA_ID=CAMNT_0026916033 /DNA_START=13 /DNA_END=486 /DNA_ORIENTATION=-